MLCLYKSCTFGHRWNLKKNQLNKFITRLLSGAVYVAVLIFCCWYHQITYLILLYVFMIICIFEFQKMISFKSLFTYFIATLLMSSFYFYDYQYQLILLAILALFLAFIPLLFDKKGQQPTRYLGNLFLSVLYIALPLSMLVKIPFLKSETYQSSIILGIFVLVWVNDSFAYLTGNFLGKHKLLKHISPKKTIEGFAGGFIFTLIAGFLLSTQIQILSSNDWLVISFIIGIFGVLGDLVESMFKRKASVKDSGNIIPGHGGVLDRLDSIIFATPFIFAYLHFT